MFIIYTMLAVIPVIAEAVLVIAGYSGSKKSRSEKKRKGKDMAFSRRSFTPFRNLGELFYNWYDGRHRKDEDIRIWRRACVMNSRDIRILRKKRIVTVSGYAVLVLVICCGWGALNIAADKGTSEDISIERSEPGGGDVDQKLFVTYKDPESDSGGVVTTEVTASVSPRKYTEKQMDELFDKGFGQAFREALGGLEAADINEDLDLKSSLSGMPFEVSYYCDDDQVMDYEGKLNREYIKSQGSVPTVLWVRLKSGNDMRQQMRQVVFTQKKMTYGEQIVQEVKDAVRSADESDPYSDSVKIKSRIGRADVSLEEGGGTMIFFILALGIPGLIWYAGKQKVIEKAEKNRSQAADTYPELLGKISLYMGAGLTVKETILRIVENYEKRRSEGGEYVYVYEELKTSAREMEAGKPERICYEEFAERVDLPVYRSLVSVLDQAVTVGSREILRKLSEMLDSGFEMRKDTARKKGEEAGTKLLIPMVILMIVVIAVVMIPALMSFDI